MGSEQLVGSICQQGELLYLCQPEVAHINLAEWAQGLEVG